MSATTTFQPQLSPEELAQRFRALVSDWKAQSRPLSNTIQMSLLRPYQQIIGLGRGVVPLILEEMTRQPGQWFWALEVITGDDPVPVTVRGNVRAMTDAWIEWGRLNHVIG